MGKINKIKDLLTSGTLTKMGVHRYIKEEKCILPPKIKVIGEGAFKNNDKIVTVTGKGVVKIKKEAFKGCKNLQEIYFTNAEKMESIGESAFADCLRLRKITFDCEINEILDDAFSGCKELQEVILNKKVFCVGNNIFKDCEKLIRITISSDIEKDPIIRILPLKNSYTEIPAESGKKILQYKGYLSGNIDKGHYIIPEEEKEINEKVLRKLNEDLAKSGDSLKILEGKEIKKICDNIFFKEYKDLSIVKLPNLKEVGIGTFEGCSKLESIELNEVTKIGDRGFANTGLIKVNFPNLEEIGEETFLECEKLECAVLKKLGIIGCYSFEGCNNLKSLTLGKVMSLGLFAFENCESLEEVIVKDDATKKMINSIHLPEGKENIVKIDGIIIGKCLKEQLMKEGYKNDGCYLIPEDKSEINNEVLQGLKEFLNLRKCSLRELKGKGIKEICDNISFKEYKDLSSVELPNLKNVGIGTFEKCENLKTIILNEIESIGKRGFANSGLVEAKFPNLKIIDKSAFKGCINLQSIKLDKVTSIGKKGFANSGLIEAKFPNLKTIGESVFKECKALKKVELSQNVTKIEKETFKECNNLFSVKLSCVTEICSGAFKNCTKLVDINGYSDLCGFDKVTTIRENAFEGCSSIWDIWFPKVTEIYSNAFKDCKKLEQIEIPLIQKLESGVFDGCEKLKEIITSEEKCEYVYKQLTEDQKNKIVIKYRKDNTLKLFNILEFKKGKENKIKNGVIEKARDVFELVEKFSKNLNR